MSSGRMRLLRAAAVTAVLAVASTACSSSSTPTASGSTPATKPADPSNSPSRPASGVPAACGVLSATEIETVLGTKLGTSTEAGTAGARSVCMFGGGLFIGVNTLGAVEDMREGAKARNITYTPVSGHGDQAWISELYGVSTALVVKGSFGVDVGFPGTDQATRDKVFELAELVLAKIA